jgi:hypothetical protein
MGKKYRTKMGGIHNEGELVDVSHLNSTCNPLLKMCGSKTLLVRGRGGGHLTRSAGTILIPHAPQHMLLPFISFLSISSVHFLGPIATGSLSSCPLSSSVLLCPPSTPAAVFFFFFFIKKKKKKKNKN